MGYLLFWREKHLYKKWFILTVFLSWIVELVFILSGITTFIFIVSSSELFFITGLIFGISYFLQYYFINYFSDDDGAVREECHKK